MLLEGRLGIFRWKFTDFEHSVDIYSLVRTLLIGDDSASILEINILMETVNCMRLTCCCKFLNESSPKSRACDDSMDWIVKSVRVHVFRNF